MEPLGYSLTWRTTCFLDCVQQVYAHTNGSGDFVLLDSLGWPWPVHACYEERFGNPESAGFDIDGSRVLGYDGRLFRSWHQIRRVTPQTPPAPKRREELGSVTDVSLGVIVNSAGFASLTTAEQKALRQQLHGKTSMFRLISGDGEEFEILFDSKHFLLKAGDIAGVVIGVQKLHHGAVFVLNKVRICWRGGARLL